MARPEPASVCWIYADEDEHIARELLQLAGVLEDQGLIQSWRLPARSGSSLGVAWLDLLQRANIVLLLVSPTLLASTQWFDIKEFLESALASKIMRVPIVVRVLVEPSPPVPELTRWSLSLPVDGRPLLGRRNREDALRDVIRGLQRLAEPRVMEVSEPALGVVAPINDPTLTINDIFRLNGPPTVTFVEPPQFALLQLELRTMGTGLIVEGPSKVGKSTAIRKAMEALGIAEQDQLWWTGQTPPPLEDFRRTLGELRDAKRNRWLFIDDFHYLEDEAYRRALAFTMKALADQPTSHGKVTIVGINPLGSSLVQTMPDLAGRFRIMRVDREPGWQRSPKVAELISLGERAANIRFRRREEFVLSAAGNFFIAQLLCNRAAAQAGIITPPVQTVEIDLGPADVVAAIRDELAARYRVPMLTFAAFDAAPPPRGAGLSLLWLLTRSDEGFAALKEARLRFPMLGPAFDWFLESNLTRCFHEHPELRGLLYFNRATGTLTMEDPQLKFYLRELDWEEFAETSGHGHISFHSEDGPLWLSPRASPTLASAPTPGGVVTDASAQLRTGDRLPPRRVLHLSDLHFSHPDQATVAYAQLSADLRELGADQLDALVVSGDLVNRAEAREYDAARLFLEQLISGFGLRASRIVLVPGNHDVSWPLSESAYKLQKRAANAAGLDDGTFIAHSPTVVEVRDDEAYRKRFEPFAALYRTVKGEEYPVAYADQGIVTDLPDLGLTILGLNSAWEIDHHFRDRASIHPQALGNALLRLGPPIEGRLRIATFHHPVHSGEDSRLRDAGFLQQLAVNGFRLVLHGHVHKADSECYRYERAAGGRQLELVAAGTFGAPVREWVPGYPLQYNLLLIGPDRITVETRCRREINGAWEPDARWRQAPGRDPLPRYTIER